MAGRWGYTPEMLRALEGLGLELMFLPEREEQRYELDFSDVDIVVCYRFFNYNDLDAFPALKYIHTTSAGLDHMPLEELARRGVAVDNARGVYSAPMAEFALGGVLQLYKKAPLMRARQTQHIWKQDRHLRELGGKTVLLVGTGSIGTECAKRFSAMGCRVEGLCRHPKKDAPFFDAQHPIAELDAHLPDADVLILCVPLTDETRHLMDDGRFARMTPGAVLVNIARGPVVDTAALLRALDAGTLSGAVLDVFEEEPLSAVSPLWDRDDVIVTPHNSFNGDGNAQRMFDLIYKDTKKWLEQRRNLP